MMIAPHIVNRPDLDPRQGRWLPVAATGRVSLYVVAHPELPVKNLAEFLAYARANPGKLNYGTPGNGTSPHIATEVFNREAKVKLNHVPYKGAGPALQGPARRGDRRGVRSGRRPPPGARRQGDA